MVLPVEEGAALSGTVKTSAGEPLDRLTVMARGKGFGASTVTDSKGAFEIHDLPRLPLRLRVVGRQGELVWDRPLSRPQVELIAARVSAVNECFY